LFYSDLIGGSYAGSRCSRDSGNGLDSSQATSQYLQSQDFMSADSQISRVSQDSYQLSQLSQEQQVKFISLIVYSCLCCHSHYQCQRKLVLVRLHFVLILVLVLHSVGFYIYTNQALSCYMIRPISHIRQKTGFCWQTRNTDSVTSLYSSFCCLSVCKLCIMDDFSPRFSCNWDPCCWLSTNCLAATDEAFNRPGQC